MAIPHSSSSSPSSSNSSTSSDYDLLRSLLRLSKDVPLYAQPKPLPRGSLASLSRRCKLLSPLFEELLTTDSAFDGLPSAASLCLREILLVLQRFKALLADCSARSRTRLLLQSDTIASEFHELNLELATLLDILPSAELDISEDVRDLVDLARRQCRRSSPAVNQAEKALKYEVLDLIHQIEREIVPDRSRLESIFERLGLDDSRSCRDEIECLEREIGDRAAQKWTAAMIALVGLVRYAKCVLYGASTPRSEPSVGKFSFSFSEPAVPQDFRCPISLELMRDPVVASSGQTYDRESITRWFGSGHATCPKTGQVLTNLDLVPNKALKNLISRWCRENNIPFEGSDPVKPESNTVSANKAALEAARMTAAFLVGKLKASPPSETANRVVHEIRQLAKSGSDNRAFVAEAGAVPLLVPLLYSQDSSLQLNAVTALLNLSIFEANKRRIMHAEGAVEALLHVMAEGASWRAKENAAAAVLSLSSVHSYRRRLGRNPRVAQQLVELVRTGPTSTKKDALAAVLSLAGERENIARLVESGAAELAVEMLDESEVGETAAGVVASLAKRGGAEAVAEVPGTVGRLVGVMRTGTERGRESAAAALVLLCRRLGGTTVAEVAVAPGVEWVIWELVGNGTERARRKAASLSRICRRWAVVSAVAAGGAGPTEALSSAVSVSASATVA